MMKGKKIRKHYGTSFNLNEVKKTVTNTTDTIKLITDINKFTKLPCIWEAGGRYGAEAVAYGILDRKWHTMKPNMVNKNSTCLEMRQAQHTVWPNSVLITGAYIKDAKNAVVINMYKMKKFDSEDIITNNNIFTRNYAVFELIKTQTYETLNLFKSSLIDLDDKDVLYRVTSEDLRQNIGNIIVKKLFGFFNQEPLLSKRWKEIQKDDIPEDVNFENTTPLSENQDKSLSTMYNDITKYAWEKSIESKNKIYAKLEVVPIEQEGEEYLIKFTTNDCYATTTYKINELKLFWFPDHDPWSDRDLEFLKKEISAAENSSKVVRYYQYIS